MDFGKKQGQLLLATGQSLSEMAMIMALVAVVGIVGLSSMSSGMLEGLKHLENGIRSQGSATSANSS
ncbi:MAG: hypothetical protein VKJ04_09080, partial [Vampirovibrionales bacterium]|nr:hypothetical protein [Vampirovibrionales bacterium]